MSESIYATIVVGQSHYSVGKKYCRRWEYYFITPKVFCGCCGMQLRANPHCGRIYKEKVRATKKNKIVWDSKRLLTRIGKGLNHGKPTTTI